MAASNPTSDFSFSLHKTRHKARAGVMSTPHGEVQTPIFMPVGTVASVKSLDSFDLEHHTQAQIILGNTYHLYLRPGLERLKALGGLHQMMNWSHPILTDSGGFQVFSLGAQATQKGIQAKSRITDEGVEFTSHLDGSKHFFSPERAIQIQQVIGADIIMAFDECTADTADLTTARQAWQRTEQWAHRCVAAWEEQGRRSEYGSYQALFGIVQGALHKELRLESAETLSKLPFDGMAVGGETIGYNMTGTAEVMSWIEHILPTEKPRYAMGLGRDPQDIVDAVLLGFDMFDCVGPTRLARNGALYHGELDTSGEKPTFKSDFAKGRLSILRQEYAMDSRVIMDTCDCFTCQQGYSRAYLHHLAKTQELAYYRLATLHNVRLMVRLTEQLRHWILS